MKNICNIKVIQKRIYERDECTPSPVCINDIIGNVTSGNSECYP